uniref:Aspartate kinase n=1 Tax=Oryza sativa subsp. japonica TaxID=39947 RepID=Q852E4_ORYSJ|nr:putative aspartate kinase [Oryza sativa Japonica Group]
MAVALRFAAVARDSPAAAAPPRVGREQQYLACAAAARPGGRCSRRRGLVVRCQSGAAAVVLNKDDAASVAAAAASSATGFTVAMKFGGSSVASAERMREVADLILSFPEETPVVVLSAMGKTTNNLLLAGEKAVSCGAPKASEIPELAVIKELHVRTIDELGLDRSIVSGIVQCFFHKIPPPSPQPTNTHTKITGSLVCLKLPIFLWLAKTYTAKCIFQSC